MFPHNQNHDQFFCPSDYTYQENLDFIQQDLISRDHASLDGSIFLTNKLSPQARQEHHSILPIDNTNAGTSKSNPHEDDDLIRKKITRKEIERQRREQMAKLYASLRSLLPLESIKGKRSASDHINEAVNHVKQMKTKIQDLNVERDKLKQISNLEASTHRNKVLRNCVSIHPCSGGIEIVINTVLKEDDVLLSTVLKVILEEGHDVVRCFSTQTNDGLCHTIHTEVCASTCVDLLGLQQKLNDIIMSP